MLLSILFCLLYSLASILLYFSFIHFWFAYFSVWSGYGRGEHEHLLAKVEGGGVGQVSLRNSG